MKMMTIKIYNLLPSGITSMISPRYPDHLKEERILAYLLNFAKEHQLEAKQDQAGNILITKPATRVEKKPHSNPPIACGHGLREEFRVEHDFDNDPIETIIDGDWIKANGTTLGADNGIGVAAQLALLAADDIAHGKIEALFTVDEETGLTGAYSLGKEFLTGNILINLDTEEEGEIYIGCAGGKGTRAYFKYKEKEAPKGYFWFRTEVKGLRGGHSGSDIDKGLGNANKILSRFLNSLTRKKYGMVLSEIGGGNLHNAIPREAYALVGVKAKYKEEIRVKINTFLADLQNEYKHTEPKLDLLLESAPIPSKVINRKTTERLLLSLCACPHGVIGMSSDIEGLVETSTNLASVKMLPDLGLR